MKKKNELNFDPVGPTWEEVEKELFTPKEIKASHRRVKFMGALINIRKALGLTQREMSDIVDVKQPMLARFESGENIPKISTASKLLKPFGLSLAIVSDETNEIICKFENSDLGGKKYE